MCTNTYGSYEKAEPLKERIKVVNELFDEGNEIIILTARENKYKKETVNFLKKNNLRFDHILFDLNIGERILINDLKPDGLKTAYAINLKRNQGTKIEF